MQKTDKIINKCSYRIAYCETEKLPYDVNVINAGMSNAHHANSLEFIVILCISQKKLYFTFFITI